MASQIVTFNEKVGDVTFREFCRSKTKPEDNMIDRSHIFKTLWSDKDYLIATKKAAEAAAKYAPFLSKVATAVDIRCCGSLGTRSVRK